VAQAERYGEAPPSEPIPESEDGDAAATGDTEANAEADPEEAAVA
jgi:hypothetical protein